MKIEFNTDLLVLFESDNDQVYIIDSNIYELYNELFNSIKDHKRIFIYNANEHTKNFDTLNKIYDFLYNNKINRNSIICGIGGVITTDIAAFAASTFKRGCRLVLIPTTLLGMIDASVGGKTGINYSNIKNGIGSFYNAERIIINSDFIKTQKEANYRDGFVEIVKMSFIPQSNLCNLLSEQQSIQKIIKEAIRTKVEICSNDPHDRSSRRLLNLGHTFGHVLESVSSYEISHGTAVAIGIRAAAKFSLQEGFITQEILKQIEERLDKYSLPVSFHSKYLPQISKIGKSILKQDKKADGKINLILFNGFQSLIIHRVDNSLEIIKTLCEFANV
mgnify:FL=1